MSNNPIGSTWKKWDLHVHTPSSVVHNYSGTDDEAWEAFLLDLDGNNVEAVHHGEARRSAPSVKITF